MGTRRRADGGQGEAAAPRWGVWVPRSGPPERGDIPAGLTRAPPRLLPFVAERAGRALAAGSPRPASGPRLKGGVRV